MALDYSVIGQRIKQARLAKNLTQEDYKELSQKLNSLKRENLHHPMEKSYIRKELAKILQLEKD